MNYRTTKLLDGTDVGASGTKVIDVNVQQPISRIRLYWQVTMPNVKAMNSYQHRDISKIELVDGSDVLFSMNGGQAQALCIYDRKIPTMNYKQKLPENSLASNYGIDFGRFLHDPMLALDPTRFRNLQLKITYDEDVAKSGVTANELEVIADLFDEKVISPIGFLMSKEHYSATPPSAGYSYIDLPTDHPFRKLLIQGYLSGYEPWYTVSEARLDEDNEKKIPFDWNIERYYRMMQAEWTPVEEGLIGDATVGGAAFYMTPTDYYTIPAIMSAGGTVAGVTCSSWQRGGVVTLLSIGGVQGAMGIVRGYLPNHCVEFPFGDPKDIDDWYDVTKLGSLRLRLKVGTYSASAIQAVVLQQLRRY